MTKHGTCLHGLDAPVTPKGACATCEREYMRVYRPGYASRKNAKERERHQRRRQEAIAHMGGKCLDCGNEDPRVLVFDHVSGGKLSNVARLLRKGWERIEAELKKCELVCANCHLIRTNERIAEQAKPDTFVPKKLRDACGRGHEFTPENTYQTERARHCRKCRADNARTARKRRAA